MRKFTRTIALVATATVAVGSLAAGFGGTAGAATPGWEPDANSVGGLLFFNAQGQQITGGNVSDQPLAADVEGTTVINAANTKATLYAALPNPSSLPTAWTPSQVSQSTTYPNASAPGALATTNLPVVTGGATDVTVAGIESALPNTTGTDANLYQLRLKTTGGGNNTTYDSADIQITGSTWSVIYPVPSLTSTTTGLSVSPSGSQVGGTSETLTATVSPSAPGTVQFFNGTPQTGTSLGSAPVTGGTAAITTTTLPVGNLSLSAVFTPATFSAYTGSTGTASLTVTQPPAAATTTGLSVNPTTAVADTSVALTADVAAGSTALGTGTGTVTFYDNGTATGDSVAAGAADLGSSPVGAGGIATLDVSTFATGTHNIVASFAPTDSTLYQPSLSLVVGFSATAPLYTPDSQTVDVSIPAGTLTISTPYTSANPFNLGTAVLDPNGANFVATAAFGTPGTDGSSTGGVTITDTRAGDPGWNASLVAAAFTGPGPIPASDLSFTGVQANSVSAQNALQPANITETDLTGLATPSVFASAAPGHSDGSIYINGELSLTAPSSTPAGSYTTTLTFTIA